MTDFLARASEISQDIIDVRRSIHMYPELGNAEFKTQAVILDWMEKYGISASPILDTGVVAVVCGERPGKTVAFRADIDALPMTENTGLPYSSKNPGVMHACGHDIHTAALLGAARILSENRDLLRGNVKFFFQPDEEGDGGARRMIDAGCMLLPDVSAVFGGHILPGLPAGQIAVKYGKCYASANPFEIIVKGRSCHGAEPEKGVDTIVVASRIVSTIQDIVSRRISPLEPAVISIGTFNAGTANNIIAHTARLTGLIRGFDGESRRKITDMVRATVNGICAIYGATAEINITDGYPGVVNDDEMTDLVVQSARRVLGPDSVTILEKATMTTEDFGYFVSASTGCFYNFGVGDTSPLHTETVIPDERAIITAAALHCQVAQDYLERYSDA